MGKFFGKTSLLLGFTMLLSVSFSACGGENEAPPVSSSEASESLSEAEAPSASSDAVDWSGAAIRPVSPAFGGTAPLANETVKEFYSSYTYGVSAAYYGKGNQYAMLPVTLEWESDEPALEYTVTLSASADLSDPVYSAKTKESRIDADPDLLYAATEYYWQVMARYDDKVIMSEVFRFETEETVRAISIDGVSNTRDMGGLMTESGKRIRQGMAYRGGRLDYITQQGRADAEKYAFRTDLDLRKAGEGFANPLGLSNYISVSAPYYALPGDALTVGCQNEENWPAIASAVRVFAEESNYPVYFHCSIGRDRTGTLAFFLEALLGVSEADIYRDYEFSLLSEAGCSDGASVSDLVYGNMYSLVKYIKDYSDGSLSENCEKFLLDTGVTAGEISSVKALLLEG